MNNDPVNDIESFHAELKAIKKAFEILLLSVEAEGPTRAREMAARLMERVDKLSRDFKTVYVTQVLERRFKPIADDQARMSDVNANDEIVAAISRMENHISLLEHETNALMSRGSPIVLWVRKRWRVILAVLGGAVAIALVWYGVRSFITRGKGLIGEYYSGTNFQKVVNRRRDLTIDFSLRNSAPIRGLTADNYSVRWTGFIRIPNDGIYEFVTRSDDGVRLWIGEDRLIDNWDIHRQETDRATRELKAGLVPVRLEWFQKKGSAAMRLLWRQGVEAQPSIISAEFLAPKAD